jgi:predicted GNAT family acetyltransferase
MSGRDPNGLEYPDEAGYPDGKGFLDEGTASVGADTRDDALQEDIQQAPPSAEAEAEVGVRRDDEREAYVADVADETVATLTYRRDGDRIVLVDTVVLPSMRGRGIAAALIGDTLDDIRDRGERVVVECPVVADYISRNPEYAQLVADD